MLYLWGSRGGTQYVCRIGTLVRRTKAMSMDLWPARFQVCIAIAIVALRQCNCQDEEGLTHGP